MRQTRPTPAAGVPSLYGCRSQPLAAVRRRRLPPPREFSPWLQQQL